MNEITEEVMRSVQEQIRELLATQPPLPPSERPTVHYTELGEVPPDGPLVTEWNCYRREVGRLLAEGYEGKWVLIQGERIISIQATEEETNWVRIERFPNQSVLMKQILTREPILRIRGYNLPWLN